ncbi:MAG: PKD domain-containing protein [Chlorobi bacterium]|nr:PKD domain-containing protein [Chlorobiota bacterium]
MKLKLPFSVLLLTIFFSFSNIENADAQGFGDFTVYPCADSAAVVALIDTVFLKSVPVYAKQNIKFYGDPSSVGYFKNGYFLGFTKGQGIIMTSGLSDDVDKENVCESGANANTNNNGVENDADLSQLANGKATHDVCIIEFQFKPTADSATFKYVFASEEYHDYVFATFNDVFGFFLSGPGINGPFSLNSKNIAEIPGTHTPVAIDNVNFGKGGITCKGKPSGCTNCEYFKDNSQSDDPNFKKFVYDGYTTSLPAKSGVSQCQWYTIRLKVGDVGDGAFDTGVFLEKGSFNLGTVDAIPEYTHPTIDSLVYESCNNHDVNMVFDLSTQMGFDYYIPYKIEGSATLGDDYQKIVNLEDTLFFPSGSTRDSIIFYSFYEDFITEGQEDIQVIYRAEMCNPFLTDTAFVLILDKPYFGDTTRRYETYCEDTITLSFGDQYLTGIPPYSYEWLPGSFLTQTFDFAISGTDSAEVYCIVSDTCGRQVLDTAIIIATPIYSNAGPDKDLCNVTSVQLEGSSEGAQAFFWTSNPVDPSLAGQETIPDPVVSPPGTTEYVLEVSDNCTHLDTDTTMALLEGASAFAIADTNVICIGDLSQLTINQGAVDETYVWTSSPNDPSLSGQENNQVVNVTPTTTTTYSVTVTNACDFTASTDISITVNPLPNASAGLDNSICFGDSFNLEASGGTDYVWTSAPVDPSLGGQDSTYNPIVTPDQQTNYTYSVQVTDANGCVNTDDMILQVDPVPDISLDVPDDFACYGETVSLTAVGTATDLTWTANPPDASLTGQETNAVINVTPLETTTYTLVGNVAGFNCPATLEQTITVKPELFSTFALQSDLVCENEALIVNYTGNAGTAANYSWYFDGASINSGSGQGPYDVQWDSEGTKTDSLTVEEDGCRAETFSLDLNVVRSPVADFISDSISGCAPLEVVFSSTSSNTTDNVTYNWDLGNGSGGTTESVSTTYIIPGQYDVKLEITNNGQCSDSKTVNAFIDVNETPVADFDLVPPESILEDDKATIDFSNTSVSGDALSYSWEFGDSQTSTTASPTHVYTQAGIYTVTLDIITANGCSSNMEKELTIHPDFVVYAPNAFSPNGDGMNDFFEIKGIGLKAYNLQVFSRWGELIFESNNIEDQWDGKYNGDFVPTGTYVYTIKYTSMLDKDKVLEGSVTVLK